MSKLRMSVATRVARRLLSLPESVLGRVAGRHRIVRDGRVLNRRVQLLLAIGERTGRARLKMDVAAARANLKQFARIGMPTITAVHVVDRRIPGPGGELPIRVYRKFGAAATPPAIVYLHGGGWVTGDLDSHDGTCRLLADVTRCVVVAVDYRLAPEHPFPAAIEDAVAAYRWVHEHTSELSIAPGRVGVMGDSAGGNLSAALALEARGLNVPPPTAQGLVYPAVDLEELRFPSHQTVGSGFGLDRAAIEWFRSLYVPAPEDRRTPRVSPLLAGDLSGLAPALVVTAGFDPLRDEGKAYADALAAAGVPVRYRCYDDMIHGFFGFGILPEGMAMATEICQAMGELMHAFVKRDT
jgi:acetyl esterase